MAGFLLKTFLSKNGISKALENLKNEEKKLPETIEREIKKALGKRFPDDDINFLLSTYSSEIDVIRKDLYQQYHKRIMERIAKLDNLVTDFSS